MSENIIYCLRTAPFDYLYTLCPLEEAQRLIGNPADQSKAFPEYTVNWAAVELDTAVQLWQSMEIGPLREPPRVWILPKIDSFDIVLLCKTENNGDCYWFGCHAALEFIAETMNGGDFLF